MPQSINATTSVYRIRGLFGVVKHDETHTTNGTIILIEYCPTLFKTRSAGQDMCNVSISYHYCIAEESDKNPIESDPMVTHNCCQF